jgi:hypothetical protein
MNYFTPGRYLALQDSMSDSAMDSADLEWERAVDQYDAYLRGILPGLPPSIRSFVELYLHDADVLSMSRAADNFVIVLQADTPPRALRTLCFSVTGQPEI